MGQAVEQRGGHLGVAEDRGPLAEGEVGSDDNRGLLIEAADQMEEQLAARLGEGQIRALSIFILSRDHDLRVCKKPCVLPHNRAGHRSALHAPLCAVHPDGSSLLVPTGVRQTVRLPPVVCFRVASAAMSGCLASPAKSLKSWRAR